MTTLYITLLCVGKLKKDYWRAACQEYEKHLRPFHHLTIIEVADEKDPADRSVQALQSLLDKEAQRLKKHIRPDHYAIALAINGNRYDSEAFANHLVELESRGKSHLLFIIGGSYGLSDEIVDLCRERLSFSPMTFPHQLMRVLFLEQLFRTAKINSGQTYHK